MSAWLLLGDLLICILWQELSHWPSLFSRDNPSTGQTHAGSIRVPPAINQQEQCILGAGGSSHLKMVGVLMVLRVEWFVGLSKPRPVSSFTTRRKMVGVYRPIKQTVG